MAKNDKYNVKIVTIPGQYATGYLSLSYGKLVISIQSKGHTATEFPAEAIGDLLRIVNLLNDAIIEWDQSHREAVDA